MHEESMKKLHPVYYHTPLLKLTANMESSACGGNETDQDEPRCLGPSRVFGEYRYTFLNAAFASCAF